MPLATTERQSSQEIDTQQIKRELYDSKEREADLRDQLKFLEDDGKKMRKKIRDLEDENDNMSKHLKKMTVQHALLSKLQSEKAVDTDCDRTEAEVELKVQYELLEEELTVLRKKMADMEEENEMLHKEMYSMEKKIKEKDHQLQLPTEPSSPNTFYMDKIKEYENEADEFRWKLLEKEKEIEQLYGQLNAYENRKSKGLRKTRSLDSSTTDVAYSHIVDLKRQLEFSQQEANVLRDKVVGLEAENSAHVSEIELLKLQTQQNNTLTGLAVAYVDTENETQLQTQIAKMNSDRIELVEKITALAEKCTSLAKSHYSSFYVQPLPIIPDETTLSTAGGMHTCEEESRDALLNFAGLKTQTIETPGNDLMESGNMAQSQKITEVKTRDPEKLLSDIDESFCVLVQRIDRMDSDEEKIVRTDSDSSEGGQPPDIPSSSLLTYEDGEKMSTEPVSAERDHLMDKILDLEEEVGKLF